ncbi:Phospholipid-binding protein, PBP family [Bosea sp. LC85]|uniref:YbhB/YbcL family Raf kinase inhibitor-like protein n=1 Tax=Bosea sp. LC85 TaxID=1502851 RepID=UPI0004E46C70|nr:YbhB/YbcL family Raf kinase inhibitor-like protein [Bosea sp. LC85]KFC69265.1 Phospholipid-binding protein, PBP family [Bosea sp. LC85]
MTLTLTSRAFAEGQAIPSKFARDGENLMPELSWTGVPDGTASLALIVEDPDAPSGTFRHLAVYNIPPDWNGLPRSVDTGSDNNLRFARNDFGNAQYDGPQPPKGHGPHHYHFRLAALDVPTINLPPDVGAERILQEARKHAIEEAELVGIYERH